MLVKLSVDKLARGNRSCCEEEGDGGYEGESKEDVMEDEHDGVRYREAAGESACNACERYRLL